MILFGFPVRRQCSRCGEIKPIEEFPQNHRGDKLIYRSECRLCHTQIQKEYHARRRAEYRARREQP